MPKRNTRSLRPCAHALRQQLTSAMLRTTFNALYRGSIFSDPCVAGVTRPTSPTTAAWPAGNAGLYIGAVLCSVRRSQRDRRALSRSWRGNRTCPYLTPEPLDQSASRASLVSRQHAGSASSASLYTLRFHRSERHRPSSAEKAIVAVLRFLKVTGLRDRL